MTGMPTTETAEKLLAQNGYPLVSIYVPTHRAGADIWQNPIRFQNLLRSAEHDLETGAVPRSQIDALMAPLRLLREDREFWQYQSDGLALFRSADTFEQFRLPATVPELSVVGSQFHLKPLLMALAGQPKYFVLAISQNLVRLFEAVSGGLREVAGLEGLNEVDSADDGAGNPTQGHSAGRGNFIVHGSEVDHKAQLTGYCRRIESAIRPLAGEGDFVIVAAVDYLARIFLHTSSLRSLSQDFIAGNPDESPADELFEKAAPIVAIHFDERRREAERRFLAAIKTGKSLDNPEEAILAARQGRLDTLFVPIGVQLWGEFAADGTVRFSDEQRPQDQDLLNLALIDTLKSGGTVLPVAPELIPGGRTVAAIVRF